MQPGRLNGRSVDCLHVAAEDAVPTVSHNGHLTRQLPVLQYDAIPVEPPFV
jgi:hypothetical protein